MKKRRIAIIGLIGLVVLGVAGWNLYGWWLKHKLERYQAELAARGEKLTIAELMADHKAPEHNSANVFLSSTAYLRRDGILSTNLPPTMRLIAPGKAMIGWQQPSLLDFSENATNTWDELAAELAECLDGITSLHEIIEHPDLDFGLDYSQGFNLLLPHLAPLKRAVQILSAAAMLELHHGNAAEAAQHIRAMLALSTASADEPVLISQLVRIAIAQISFNATWELLQSSNITEAGLQQLQADWSSLRFVGPMRRSLEMERAMGSMTIRHYRERGGLYDMFGTTTTPAPASTTEAVMAKTKQRFSPREIRKNSNELLWQSALSYEDELQAAQGMQVLIDACRNIEAGAVFGSTLSNVVLQLEMMGQIGQSDSESLWPGDDDLSMASLRHIFGGSADMMLKSLNKVRVIEANCSLVVTAIALKRYQLAHGEIPASLSALVPKYLPAVPTDPVDGQPLRYQRKPDGSFLLYSIGEDGVDDGGDGSRPSGSSSNRPNMVYSRDWVWPQPATPEEIKAWEAEERERFSGQYNSIREGLVPPPAAPNSGD